MKKSIVIKTLLFCCLLVLITACKSTFKQKWAKVEAPAYFTAKFETSKGNFEIESRKEWSPEAVNRLYGLIQSGFYTDIAIFRVLPNYIAQFGIHNDSLVNKAWNEIKVIDEPVLKKNTKGTLCFARGEPETRGTALFINLEDNTPFLDTIAFMDVTGFPVVAQITSGLDVANSFYNGYGAELDEKQDSIYKFGNEYLKNKYPKLDYIKKAYITGRSPKDEIK